jgi:thiamine pyrophosphokinase
VENRILGVLGGNDVSDKMLQFWAQSATLLVAADQGADRLVGAGFFPHVVLGDLDSIQLEHGAHSITVHHLADQESSDCDKLLRFLEDQGHTEVTIIGFEGDRLDHVLAGIGSFLQTSLKVRIVIRHGLAHVQTRSNEVYRAYGGQTVSLLPILPSKGITTQGLTWELENADLSLGARVSLSNLAMGSEFQVHLAEGALLVVQEYDEARMPGW